MSETNLKLIYDTVNEAYPQYSSEFGDYEKFKNKMQNPANAEQIRKLLVDRHGEDVLGDSAFFSEKIKIPLDTEENQYNNIVETPAEDLLNKEIELVSNNKNGIIEEVSQPIELPDDLIKSDNLIKSEGVVDRSILDKISPTEEVATSLKVADVPGASPDPFLDAIGGLVEIPLSIGTGMIGWGSSGIIGGTERVLANIGLIEGIDPNLQEEWIAELQEKMTYIPRTESGDLGVRIITLPWEYYMQGVKFIGDKVYDVTGSPVAGAATQSLLGGAPFLISPARAKYNTYKQNKINGKSLTIHKWSDKQFHSKYFQDIMIDDIVIRGMSTEKFMKKWGIPDNMKNVVESSKERLIREVAEWAEFEVVEPPLLKEGKKAAKETKVDPVVEPTVEPKVLDLSKKESHKKAINPDKVKEVTIEEVGENHVVQVIDKNNKVIDAEVYPTLQEAQIALSSFAEISLIDKGIIAKPPSVEKPLEEVPTKPKVETKVTKPKETKKDKDSIWEEDIDIVDGTPIQRSAMGPNEGKWYRTKDKNQKIPAEDIIEVVSLEELIPKTSPTYKDGRRVVKMQESPKHKSEKGVVYHVTFAGETIKKEGIKPSSPDRRLWRQQATGKKYGEGEIYSFESINDAIAWAKKMEYELDIPVERLSIVKIRKEPRPKETKAKDTKLEPKVEPKENVGYRSGERGEISESIGYGGHGTGHFGTGEYFFGGKDAAKSYKKDRQVTEIDVTGKNLFRPEEYTSSTAKIPGEKKGDPPTPMKISQREAGIELHDVLKAINSRAQGGRTPGLTIDKIVTQLNDIGVKVTKKDVQRIILETKKDIKAFNEKYNFNERKKITSDPNINIESASTRVMRKAGYDGIDVRGIKGLDNASYGSVIYPEKAPASKPSKITPKAPIEATEFSNLLEGEKFLSIIDGKVKGNKKDAKTELSNLLDRLDIGSFSEYRKKLSEAKKEVPATAKPKVEPKVNVGYQSGKGVSKKDNINMMFGRETGHFGSGTYFFGSKKDAKKHAKSREGGDRPITVINLEGKNLFRPFDMTRVVGKKKDGSPLTEIIPAGGNFGMANELHWILRYINEASYRLGDYDAKNNPNSISWRDNPTGISKRLEYWTGLKASPKIVDEVIQEVRAEIEANDGFGGLNTETASTRLMRRLGYDGIDMRGIEGFDNAKFGSVIYPEKPPVSKPTIVKPKKTKPKPPEKKTGEVKAETLPDKLLELDKMVSDLNKKEFNKTITAEERIKLGQIRRVQSNIRGKIKKDKDEILSAEKDIAESARSFKGKLNIVDSKITALEGKKNRTSKENSDLKLYKNEKAKILRDEKVYQIEVKKDTILRLNKTISDTQKQIVFAKKNPFGRTKRDISNLDKRLKIAKKLKKQLEDEGLSVSHEVYGQLYSSMIPPPIIHLFKLLENKYKAGKKKPFTDADLEQIDYIISKGGTSIPKHELDFLNDTYMLQDKAHRIFLEKIRKRKLEISKANMVASEWTKTVPNELDRFDIGASIEGIGNIMIEGDTIVDVKSRMTPAKEKAKKEYKIAIEKTRNDINELLAEATGAEGEYIQFLENYLPHFYVTTGKGKDFGPAIDIIKNSPNAKKRKLPTLQDAKDAGLVPISQDPVVLYNKYINTNWSMATNKLFLDKLSKVTDIDGNPMIVPDNKKAPSNYVRFDHPLANRIFGKKDENGFVQPTSFGVRVHPDVLPVLKMLKKYQYDMSPEGLINIGKAYDKVNAVQKTFQLSVSFFHHIALTESSQAVLAGKNPIRGIFLFGEKNPTTNKTELFRAPYRVGLELIKDEAFYEDMIMHGLQIEHPNLDNHTGTWINQRDGFKDWFDSPIWKNSIQAAYYPIIAFQKGLWNHYHSGLKAFAYNDVVNKSLDLYPELSSTEVKELTASLINDAFGGQEWESRLILGNPKVQKWLTRILLAPDWTTSSASMAYKPVADGLGLIGRDPRFKDPKFRNMKGKFYSNYWKNIIFSVLGAQQLLQLAIYEKYGDEEKGDKPYMWENETGEQWSADITPLYRALAESSGKEWTTDQRYYTSFGKQYKEIAGYFDGFAGPINTFKRKSSPMVGYVYELVTGYSTSDFPSEWRGEGPSGWASGFSERFVPFSLKGNSFAWALPVHKGMTRYEGRELMDKVIESYIDPSIYQRAINKYGSDKLEPIFGKKFKNFEPELEKFVPEVFDALERNGFKPMEVLTNTVSRASKKLFNEFIGVAMDESGNWKNPDDMSEKDKFLIDYTAYKLAKLNKVSDSLYRSIQARTKTGAVSREGKNFQKVLDIWNEAFKDFDDWDTIEDAWASDAIKNGYFTKYQKDIINLDRVTRYIGMGSGKKSN